MILVTRERINKSIITYRIKNDQQHDPQGCPDRVLTLSHWGRLKENDVSCIKNDWKNKVHLAYLLKGRGGKEIKSRKSYYYIGFSI